MIDFANKTELMFFAITAALAVIALVCDLVFAIRKRAGKTGVLLYIVAWIIILPAIALTLLALIARFSPLGITAEVVGSEVVVLKSAAELFKIPYIGGYLSVVFTRFIMEVLVYAIALFTLIALIILPIKWRSHAGQSQDGDGYLSVKDGQTDLSVEPTAEENADQPTEPSVDLMETVEEAQEESLDEVVAQSEETQPVTEPITIADEEPEQPIEQEESADEETAQPTKEAEVEIEPAEENSEPVAVEPVTQLEPAEELVAVEQEAEGTAEPVELPAPAKKDIKPSGKIDYTAFDLTLQTVQRRKRARNADDEVKTEEPAVQPVEQPVPAPIAEQPIEQPVQPIDQVEKEKAVQSKRKKRVSGKAAQMFGEYMMSKSDEDKTKLFASIDTVSLDKKDE